MLTVSPSLKLVISRTLPLMVGLFAIMLVQLVDSIFIGMLGVDELAVYGVTLPFQAALIGIQVGIGVAATAIISQAAGAKQDGKSAATATITVVFGIFFISMVCLLLWGLNERVFALFISTEITREKFELLLGIFNCYWPVWLLSCITVAALYLVTCVYRANGDTKTTGTMFVAASIINLILDPVLIFLFEMGIEGAAIASSVGYAGSALYMLFKVRGKQWFRPVYFSAATLSYFSELIRVTIPTTVNQILPSASAFVGMMLISRMGTDAIAFWSLLSRIESFLLVFTLALTMSIPPMIGHYLGECRQDKISDLLITTAKFLLLFHIGIAFLLAMGADMIIPVISKDVRINAWLEVALWIIPLSYGPLGLCMLVVSVFNALGGPKTALMVSFIRLFILYIPAIWIGSISASVVNTVIAATIANVMAGIFAWFKLKQYIKVSIPCGPNIVLI